MLEQFLSISLGADCERATFVGIGNVCLCVCVCVWNVSLSFGQEGGTINIGNKVTSEKGLSMVSRWISGDMISTG